MPDPTLDTNLLDIPARTLRVVQNLYRARNLLWERDRRQVEATGLSWGQAQTLIALLAAGPNFCLSPTKLSEEVQASSGGMTKMLAGLEATGDVERIPDPDDGRSRLVRLTASGRDRVSALAQDLGAVNTEILAGALSPQEQDALGDALERLSASLGGGPWLGNGGG